MEDHPAAVVTADPPVGHLYTTDEVAKLLRVSQRTVQVWIRDGMLTAVRYGRLLRVRQADLATFGEVLTRHTPPTASPSPPPAGATQECAPPAARTAVHAAGHPGPGGCASGNGGRARR